MKMIKIIKMIGRRISCFVLLIMKLALANKANFTKKRFGCKGKCYYSEM